MVSTSHIVSGTTSGCGVRDKNEVGRRIENNMRTQRKKLAEIKRCLEVGLQFIKIKGNPRGN